MYIIDSPRKFLRRIFLFPKKNDLVLAYLENDVNDAKIGKNLFLGLFANTITLIIRKQLRVVELLD